MSFYTPCQQVFAEFRQKSEAKKPPAEFLEKLRRWHAEDVAERVKRENRTPPFQPIGSVL